MSHFARNVSFAAVDLAGIIRERPSFVQGLFQSMMALVEQNILHPPRPLNIYPVSDVVKAFRQLQSGSSVGKTVIEYHPDDMVPVRLFADDLEFNGTEHLHRQI